jgi:syntaxin 5
MKNMSLRNGFFVVAKRKSLFDDKSVEIQELTFIIKEDINALNQDIAKVS